MINRIRIIGRMKNRQKVKDYFQIGNYIYADLYGRIAVVIPKGIKLKDSEIANDINTLVKEYGVDAANFFIDYCSKYINSKR